MHERSSAARRSLRRQDCVHPSPIRVRNSTSGRGPTWLITSAAAIDPKCPQRSRSNPVRVAVQEPGGEQVAGAGGVEHLVDGLGRDTQHLVRGDDHASLRTDGDRRELAFVTQRRRLRRRTSRPRRATAVRPRCRTACRPVLDQRAEVVAVPVDAERVAQRQRHHPTVGVGDFGRMTERLLRIVAVEQVALHVQHLGAAITSSSMSSAHSRLDTPR